MAYHIASSTTVYHYTYWVMGVEGINIGGLAGVYTESWRLLIVIKITIHVIKFPIVGTCCCFIIEDVGNLLCHSNIFRILLWEMKAIA